MKSLCYLIANKQKWNLVIFAILLAITCVIFAGGKHYAQSAVKIPIAVQDLDKSETSKAIVKTLKENKTLNVQYLDEDDAFIEDVVKKKTAVISLSIPKAFEKNLKKRQIRRAVQLYEKGDFVSTIGVELMSKTFFEMQIPYIIKHYEIEHHELKVIQQYYKDNKPTDAISHKAKYHSSQSIQMGLLLALILCVSLVQLYLHRNLAQFEVLKRVYFFQYTKLMLPIVYTLVNTFLIFVVFFIGSSWIDGQLNFHFYFVSLLFILFHTCFMCLCLIKIRTLSHRTFIATSFTFMLACFVIFIQL